MTKKQEELNTNTINMEFIPMDTKVLIELPQKEVKNSSGLEFTVKETETTLRGKILAVGPNSQHSEIDDIAVFYAHDGVELELEGNTHKLIKEQDLYGLIKR